MASNHGGKDVMESEVNNSEATVEIKIKTLDSQTYTLRVDKQVPVPALKEQIASVTGVLSDQQRLICRGKVLKDDQLLSAYHVEDGHTLHLVARQPINPLLASFSDHSGSDPASNSSRQSMGSQHGPSVVVGTFNISDQGDGGIPDFSRIVSAVLGSFGIANAASGGETVDLQQHISERLSRIPGLNEIRSSNGQPQQQSEGSQPSSQNATFTLPTDVSMESLQLPVIPDSLSTLSQYLRRLRQEFNDNVRIQGNNAQGFGVQEGSSNAPNSSIGQAGLPTPSALGEVTNSTRQLLIEQAGECLQQLTRQLSDQTNVTDRLRTQSYALRSGALLQNLGAFLLELGRTTMTLRLGQSPTEAVVNAGPAVFISTSGPNPIMVQPLPFQPGTTFGTASSGSATFSVGSGLRPRNIDIRIRTGSVLSSGVNQREGNNGDQSGTDSGNGTTNQEGGTRVQSRGSEVRVVPIRISTMPPGLAPSETSRSSMGVIYPVLARAQSVEVGNVNGSNGHVSNGGETRPHVVPDANTEVPSGLDQLLRNLFSGEQAHGNGESVPTGVTSSGPPAVTDEGAFLSNLLHQILPVVSQHLNGQPSTSADENQDRGASSQQSDDPPSSKRQKRE